MEVAREVQDETTETEIVIVIIETAVVMIGMIDVDHIETTETTGIEDVILLVEEVGLDHHLAKEVLHHLQENNRQN